MPRKPTSHRHRRPPTPGPTRKRPNTEPAVGTLPPWGETEEEGKAR